MRTNSLAWQCAACILACVLWTHAGGQDFGDFEQLTFEIATSAHEILPIEPLPITFTLSNNSERPIKAHGSIRPAYGFVRLYIARENGPFERFHSSDEGCHLDMIDREIALKPGFRESVSTHIFYAQPRNLDKENVGKYLIESPGTYRLKAEFTNLRDKRAIESNTLTITAVEPTGENAAAYQFLKSLQSSVPQDVYYGSFLLYPADRPKVLAKQKEFVWRFPGSRYARYIYYTWGQTFRSSKDKDDAQRGTTYLEKAAGYKDFFLAEDAMSMLIETLSKQAQSAKARRYKEIFTKRFPDSPACREYLEQMLTSPLPGRSHPPGWILGALAGGALIIVCLWLVRRKTAGAT